MSWPLRRVEWKTPYSELKPGDWWTRRLDEQLESGLTLEQAFGGFLSPEFRASGRQEVIWIRLPGDCGYWSPDYRFDGRGAHGWALTLNEKGEPVTAMPSIGAGSCYHGWLRDGALTDDCEGRVFP